MVGLIVLAGLVVLAVGTLGWFVGGYNQLVALRQQVTNAWSQIDVQLKRRHDLIPNLVEAAKGYMQFERDTLERVIQARGQAVSVQGVPEKIAAEHALTQALRSFFAVVERYPELRANQNVMALQQELTATENTLAGARQAYNNDAQQLNTAIQTVPLNLVAAISGFRPAAFFGITDEAERQVPQVKL